MMHIQPFSLNLNTSTGRHKSGVLGVSQVPPPMRLSLSHSPSLSSGPARRCDSSPPQQGCGGALASLTAPSATRPRPLVGGQQAQRCSLGPVNITLYGKRYAHVKDFERSALSDFLGAP